MLQERREKCFQLFFDGDQPSHGTLTAYAVDPREAAGLNDRGTVATHCPLCRFPTQVFEPHPAQLGPQVVAAIVHDFPNWSPTDGLCTQCADLYRASRLSAAAAKALPGCNFQASMHDQDQSGNEAAPAPAA